MNPIMQMLNMQKQMNSVSNLVNALKNGNPSYMYEVMMKNNPQFRSFVEENKDKTVDEIARNYGIDLNVINQLLR